MKKTSNELLHFAQNTPNLKHFEVNQISEVHEDMIEVAIQHWPNLQNLRLWGSAIYEYDSEELLSLYTAIKSHCRKLRSFEYRFSCKNCIDMEYSFFTNIPSLRKVYMDHWLLYRKDYYNIADYVKTHKIPYWYLGALKNIIEEYTLGKIKDANK